MGHGRRLAALTAIAIAALALAPGAASASVTQYPTLFTKFKYELRNEKSSFKGKIDSTKGGCVPDRKVKLFRRKQGNTKKLGADHTDGKGKFAIGLGGGPPKEGTYYAKVKQAKIGGQGSEKTCLARTSPSVKLSD